MRQTQKSKKFDIVASAIKEIKNGKIYPIYLLCGEEYFLIENTLTQMLDILVPKDTRDFNLEIYNGLEVSVDEIITSAETYPVMAKRRVIVVKEPTFFSSKGLSNLDIFRSAVEAYESQNPTKAINLLAKALEIPAAELVEDSIAVKTAISNFVEDNKEELSSEDQQFLSELPEIIAQADVRPSSPDGASEAERLMQWLEDDLPTSSVVILTVTGSVDARSKLFKAIGTVGKVEIFDRQKVGRSPAEDKTFQMVVNKLRESGKAITYNAFQKIREKTGENMHLIFGELEKLVAFTQGKPRIDVNDVEGLVAQSSFDDIFDLTDAIANKSLASALAILNSTLQSGEPPIKIHAMITRQIRLMLQAKLLIQQGGLSNLARMDYKNFVNAYRSLPKELSDQLPTDRKFNLLKQSPYPVYLALRQNNNFTLPELLDAMERLLEADIQLKSSQFEPGLILEQLIVELCSSPKYKSVYNGTNTISP
ncbi:TPA: DNA polymerase III subunit delta [Candidatus Poribacteria bacterium]|nr:DNA polymerase III subunit delta [Candidatus Poribacteria bacterium]